MATDQVQGVEVKVVNSDKGKGLFACQAFKKGDQIFEEVPLVCSQFLWNEFYKYEACEFCLKSLETAENMARRLTSISTLELPQKQNCTVRPDQYICCPHCQVVYCSKECMETAWKKYHCTLCMGSSREDESHPLGMLQVAWRNIHFPPESCSIMLLAKMICMVKQSNDPEAVLKAFSQFTNSTVNEEEQIMHKLLGPQFKEQLETFRSMVMLSLYDEHIPQWFTYEGFQSLFALIGRNGQGIGTSSISVWCQNCDAMDLHPDERISIDSFIDQLYVDLERESGTFLNCEGSGLYSMQSCCNHSCVPNAEVQFPHNCHKLRVVALEDIVPGEEICISYLDGCMLERSRHSRQKHLRDNYLFNCKCIKCQSQCDEPDITSSEEDEEEEDMEAEVT
ncbi:SET and MYND domain-containing protein 5 [Octopus vulgaris]|uniref:SET and MYND domain-containing protein 5 n=2 Tax=Octopus TaxID=6643 RepID=A0AA36BG71_OCTVU|nr:SET and MYND domain-containing protein 5 [Octopus sinensis]CAI9733077.1 SET and MYND domain-containing protein 5 [Octopus vulgaris]